MAKKSLECSSMAAVVLIVASLFTTPSLANPGILLDARICDNQAVAFGVIWKSYHLDDPRLFFVSGNDAHGNIHAINHGDPFDGSQDVTIFSHGNVGRVGNFSGADFATVFRANHPTAPGNVNFYSCNSGTIPLDGVSNMALLARAFPAENDPNATLIGSMNAPGHGTCPAQRGPATETGAAVATIAESVMRTNVGHLGHYAGLVATLQGQWAGNGVHYPGTNQSFGQYCQQQLVNDPTGQWVPGFLEQVHTQFGAEYLALINSNYGGDEFVTCGANNNVICN